MKKKTIFIAIALVILLAVGAGILVLKNNEIKKQEKLKVQQQEEAKKIEEEKQTAQEDNIDMSDWKTYRNEKYGFEVKYPRDIKVEEISSGSSKGYIVDFRFSAGTIRIESSRNSRQDKTLEKLLEVRDNIGMHLYSSDKYNYYEKTINNNQAFQYERSFSQEEKNYITINTLLLGRDYYYQIISNIPSGYNFSSEAKATYNSFINTFELL